MIFETSQKALDLGYDGLIIESHIDPDNAWSDAKQQVIPSRLVEIMNDLKIRKETTNEESYLKELQSLREKIDISDQIILDTLVKRMKVSQSIGKLKKDNNVAVLQNKRWNEILASMQSEGGERGLSEEFISRIFKAIHQESINHQEKVING